MSAAISIRNLGKCYRMNHADARSPYRTIRESLARAAAAPLRTLRGHANGADNEFWALKDLDFDIQPGEVVGIVGHNGAGKSTLLKILSRITKPTIGQIDISGRVGSLLEVGTGFHPELTGRENVYMNGSILGMQRREIDGSFDSIVEFAGVERFLDTPVKRYSSGMQVRLAFAVASHLQPEILLIDEVLAVGDQQFQKRCTQKMRDVANSGRTVVFVSHNIPAVQNLCNRAILLEHGRTIEDGDVGHTLSVYSARQLGGINRDTSLVAHTGRAQHYMRWMETASITSQTNGGTILMGDDVRIDVTFRATESVDNVNFGIVVKDSLGAALFTANNVVQPSQPLAHPLRRGSISCLLDKLPLLPGTYLLDFYLGTNGAHCDVVVDAISFDVHAADVFGSGKLQSTQFGRFFCPVKWLIRGAQ